VSAIVLLALRIILAALLYAFLGWAIYILWKDIKRQSELSANRLPPPLTLKTELDSQPLIRHYSCPEIILGRDASSDFPISDQTVSSHHARLSYHQNQWWLEDMTSTNGTFLNGEAVTEPVVITQGDKLRLGQVGVMIQIGSDNNQA
jgi:pSer/pThr/pTyr-binding forkhead associated (FHA) protein